MATSVVLSQIKQSTSDDNVMMKQIMTTHAPDGREIDVKPLLHIIEDIMRHSTPVTQAHLEDALDEKTLDSGFNDMLELLADTINRISCEISCNCSGGGDAHATTVALFKTLSNYSWEAKVVISLAGFSVTYGEFWLVAQLYPTNPLAKSVALLKQLPDILERAEYLKPIVEAVTEIINAMLDVTKCIIKFKDLPSQYITADTPEMLTATDRIPTAVYWTIRSIVECASILMNLIGMSRDSRYDTLTIEAGKLSTLALKVRNINDDLSKQLDLCYHRIDEERHIEDAYQTLVDLFKKQHISNMKILKALIDAKDDQLPLFDGSTKKRVSVEILKRKLVLFLISDPDISDEELSILGQIYNESRQQPTKKESQYDVVWLPVVEKSSIPWDKIKQNQLQTTQNKMPWYSVFHPDLLGPAVIKYIKEVWRFNKKPFLVVLHPHGRIVNPNALPMMRIWGNVAFPFNCAREEILWKEQTWKIELLMDSIEPKIANWIGEGKYVCLYGGEDIEWIRRFTQSLRSVAQSAGIALEMIYLGKSNPKEKVKENNSTIDAESLSNVLPDLNRIWSFWARLESMWHSKMQYGRTVENDTIMKEIMTMLSFDGSGQGWAVISHGSELAKAKGDTIEESLKLFEEWRGFVETKGFIGALTDHLHGLHTPDHCIRLILQVTTGSLPDRVVCPECNRSMERFIMYRCCTD